MKLPDEIDVRKLSQPTLAQMVMTYVRMHHDQIEQINRVTAEFIETGEVK